MKPEWLPTQRSEAEPPQADRSHGDHAGVGGHAAVMSGQDESGNQSGRRGRRSNGAESSPLHRSELGAPEQLGQRRGQQRRDQGRRQEVEEMPASVDEVQTKSLYVRRGAAVREGQATRSATDPDFIIGG